jgi:hypothetical protein
VNRSIRPITLFVHPVGTKTKAEYIPIGAVKKLWLLREGIMIAYLMDIVFCGPVEDLNGGFQDFCAGSTEGLTLAFYRTC